jgi:chemotaxis protein CheD
MKKPPHTIEIFLQPGEVYFAERDTRIRTLLGSCVAITMWHPGTLVGGMCHYMLPGSLDGQRDKLDGRYGDEAMVLMQMEIRKTNTQPQDYQVKLFGGGHMFSKYPSVNTDHVGAKNVEMARSLMKRHGFKVQAEHLGGAGHRTLMFDLWNGQVWMRHQPPPAVATHHTRDLCLV